jgi:hypothetical protein
MSAGFSLLPGLFLREIKIAFNCFFSFRRASNFILCILFQAESVREAAWGCDWVGTPVSFQRCLVFITASANKGFTLTAAKFVPVSNKTMIKVGMHLLTCLGKCT